MKSKNVFSTAWNKSTQPRKQRRYRYTAPLHIQQKYVHVHLSSPLRKKYGVRNIQVRKGDKVKIARGQFSGKEGKVERVHLKRGVIFVNGIETVKKEGSKVFLPLQPSNVIIIELDLNDKKRKKGIEDSSRRKATPPSPQSKSIEEGTQK